MSIVQEQYERTQIFKAAINKWGKEIQVEIAIEEMAELIKALQKIKRNSDDSTQWMELIHNVWEEIADVEIMLEQIKLIYGVVGVNDFKEAKLKRLKDRINA